MTADPSVSELIYTAAALAYEEWRKEHPSERLFAFVLSSLDDAIYVNVGLNTIESHERRLADRKIEGDSAFGRDTKWGCWEWEHEFIGSRDIFSVLFARLKEMYEQWPGEFSEFKAMVFDSMFAALIQLRENSVISNAGNSSGILMYATVYDSYSAEELHRKSAEFLNPPELVPPAIVREFLATVGG
jgi:hypothetical protein